MHHHSELPDNTLSVSRQIQLEQDVLDRIIEWNKDAPFKDQKHYQKLISYHQKNINELRKLSPNISEPPGRISEVEERTRESTNRIVSEYHKSQNP